MRYAVYDGKSKVITPIGEELTAEQWLARYPWAKYTKMIVGGGVINGSVAIVFDDYVEMARKNGCDFTGCNTDEEYLAKIEEFEDTPSTRTVTAEERIASALEAQVMMAMPDVDA